MILTRHIFTPTDAVYNKKITDLATVMSEEDKKKSVLDNTYLLLDTSDSGRSYRSKIMMDGFSDWIYRTYQSIVYGNTSDYYSGTYQTLKSNASNSFLSINNYADNPWTSSDYRKLCNSSNLCFSNNYINCNSNRSIKSKENKLVLFSYSNGSKFIYINAISRRNNSICK